jgi:hypothetical protein
MWRVQERFPRYGVPTCIWSLWPNIRFLPSTVTEKNATNNILDGRRTDGQTEVKQYTGYNYFNYNFTRLYIRYYEKFSRIQGSVFGSIRFILPVCRFRKILYTFNIHLHMHIFRRIFLSNYWWQESAIWSHASYRYGILWEAFLDPLHCRNYNYIIVKKKIAKYNWFIWKLKMWTEQDELWANAHLWYPCSSTNRK